MIDLAIHLAELTKVSVRLRLGDIILSKSIWVIIKKMEQSLSLMVFSQARCPRCAFSMYNISFRGALLEPHAISRFRVRYLQK